MLYFNLYNERPQNKTADSGETRKTQLHVMFFVYTLALLFGS